MSKKIAAIERIYNIFAKSENITLPTDLVPKRSFINIFSTSSPFFLAECQYKRLLQNLSICRSLLERELAD